MKVAYTAHLLLACSAIILSACGGGGGTAVTEETPTTTTTTDTTPTTTDTTPVVPESMYSLEDWRKPRIYAKGTVIASCNQDKVFSLRPHKDSIEARFVDFTLGTSQDAIYPSGYTLRATQARDSNSVISLTF